MLSQTVLDGSFKLTLYPRKWEDLVSAVLGAGCKIIPFAMAVGKRLPTVEREFVGRYVMISSTDLGSREPTERSVIYDLARRAGLAECHPQAGWELLIARYRASLPEYRPKADQKMTPEMEIADKILHLPIRDLLIGSEPIKMGPNFFQLFEIRDGQTMSTEAGDGIISLREGREWLFKVA